MLKLTLVQMLVFTYSICIGQKVQGLEKGDLFPDFKFDNIKYYDKGTSASLSDFKGKWLVLDFWTEYCTGCINGFPEVNRLQKKYKDDFKFVLVGVTDMSWLSSRLTSNVQRMEKIFERAKSIMGLDLTVAYDSVLAKKYKISLYPVTVVIDPNGKIRGLGSILRDKDIDDFLDNKSPVLRNGVPIVGQNYDLNIPLLTNAKPSNGGVDTTFLFRSIITQWNSSMKVSYPEQLVSFNMPGTFEALGIDLKTLYKMAYIGRYRWEFARDSMYGKWSPEVILNIRDSTNFSRLYSYSVSIPDSLIEFTPDGNTSLFKRLLKSDLYNYFQYKISIEERRMPCWILRVTNASMRNHLKSQTDSSYVHNNSILGFTAKNVSVMSLLDLINPSSERLPIIDETNIKFNIDLTVDALLTDGKTDNIEMINQLKSQGLTLTKGRRKMKVLVISEPDPNL